MHLTSPIAVSGFFGVAGAAIYLSVIGHNQMFAVLLMVFFAVVLGLYALQSARTSDERLPASIPAQSIEDRFANPRLISYIGIGAGVAALFVLARSAGSLSPMVVASYHSELRYQSEVGMPIAVRALNVVVYSSAIISMAVFFERARSPLSRRIVYALPPTLLIVEAFLLGTKSVVVLTVIYGIVTWRLVTLTHGRRVRLGRLGLRLLILVAAAAGIAVAVHYVRTDGRADVSDLLLKILTSYFFVPFLALIESSGSDWKLAGVGYESFAGLMGLVDPSAGARGDPIAFDLGDGVLTTNVYTAYHALFSDFGLIGGLLLLAVGLWGVACLERRIVAGRLMAFGLYLPLATYFMFSFAGPVFKFTTNVAVFFTVFIYLRFSLRRHTRQSTRSINLIVPRPLASRTVDLAPAPKFVSVRAGVPHASAPGRSARSNNLQWGDRSVPVGH